jgi:hypothetical protein
MTIKILFYSSFLFLLVAYIAIQYYYYIYSLLFIALFCTSILFYTNSCYYLLDQCAIMACVLNGAYTFYNKFKLTIGAVLIIYTFIFTLLLFYGGLYLTEFCYCTHYGNYWHVIVHLLTIIGHIGIIIL